MDNVQDLLSKYTPKEPPEIALVKKYINNTFHAPATVTVQETSILIVVKSAALANALRLRTLDMQTACQTDKRFVFRIG